MKQLKKYLEVLEQYMLRRYEKDGERFMDEWLHNNYDTADGLDGLDALKVDCNGEPMYVQLAERKAYKDPIEAIKNIFFKDDLVMVCNVSDWIDHFLEEVKNEDWICYDYTQEEEINQWLKDNETEFDEWLKKKGYAM